jgi:protein involved in polysaccharide export with SLBB domain
MFKSLLALALGICCSAASMAQSPPSQTTVSASSAAVEPVVGSAPAPVGQDYRLGVADHVRVIVYNETDLSGEFTVNANGMLSLPLIGDVKAIDRTTNEVIADIQTRLADGYLKEPRVSMDVLTYRPFYILGEVSKPGEYAYSNGLTVMSAVATAQGFTYRANKHIVFIKSAGSDSEKKTELSPNILVKPGDTIRIGERYF